MAGRRHTNEPRAFRYATLAGTNRKMATTYTQIYMHIVFAAARREALIDNQWTPVPHAHLALLLSVFFVNAEFCKEPNFREFCNSMGR